jgi:methyl-accepting chemotaxis protein
MTVKQRLMLLIASAVIGLVLVAGAGISEIGRVYTAANFANDNTVPALSALNKLVIGLGDERIRILRHVFFANDAEKMEKVARTVQAAEQDVLDALKAYEGTIVDDEDRRRFNQIAEQYQAFKAAKGPVLEQSSANRKDQARELVAALDSAGKKLGDSIDELIAYNIELGHKAAVEAKRIKGNASILFLVIAALSIALAIGVGLFILRALTRQLGGEPAYAAEIATRMAAGEVMDIAVEAGDTESLLAAMKRMMETFKGFVAAQQENAAQHEIGMIDHQISVERFRGVYGQMAQSINALVQSHIAVKMRVVQVVERYAIGDLSMDMDRLPGKKAQITDAIDSVKASLQAVNAQIKGLVDAAVAGNFKARGDAGRFQYEFRDMIEGMNRLMDVSDVGLGEVSRILEGLAKGDLTQRIDGDYQGTFGKLQEDANTTVERLRDVVGQIKEATDAIDTAAKEIAAGNQDLSSRTEEQASSLEETASSMEELNATVKQNAENARQANELAQTSNVNVSRGGDAVKRVVTTMGDIQDSSRKIADIISVIDGIAFQTNILALNAAVEAARAGEQGRGFAVVAAEVRNLAQRSATAAKEIKDLIAESVSKVEGGAKLVDEAGAAMDEVVATSRQVAVLVTEITHASREQSSGIDQVAQAIGQMDDITQQNAALVEEAAAAAESLEEQTQGLVRSVSMFRLAPGSTSLHVTARRDATPKRLEKPAARLAKPAKGMAARRPSPVISQPEEDWAEF